MAIDRSYLQNFKDRGGLFLTWNQVRLAALGVFLLLIGLIVLGLFMNHECKCAMQDIHESEPDRFWQRCLDRSTCPLNGAYQNRPVKNHRLSSSLIPIHYNIEVRPYFYSGNESEFVLRGYTEIYLNCTEETNTIRFHAQMTLDQVTIVTNSSTVSLLDLSIDKETELAEVKMEKMLIVGETLKVKVNYTTKIGTEIRGIFYTSYWDTSMHKMQYTVATDMQPTGARLVFPCLDEPALKATFNISIWRQKDYVALTNMPLHDSVKMEDGWYMDHFETTPIMSTYLIALVVSQYDHITITASAGLTDKYVRFFAPVKDIEQGHIEYARNAAARMFDWLEGHLNVPFTLPQLDMIGLYNYTFGGMENWGLVVLLRSSLVMDQTWHTVSQERGLLSIIAHELAHMWFGNLVTCEWWSDTWLNEGFATFYARLTTSETFDDLKSGDVDTPINFGFALQRDSSVGNYRLYQEVSTASEAAMMFRPQTYYKGSYLVRMMREIVGHKTFDTAMTTYLRRLSYQSAGHDDLFAVIEEQLYIDSVAIGTNFTEFMYSWIKQMGHPILHIERSNVTSSEITVTQSLFYHGNSKHPEANNVWIVPFIYATKNEPDLNNPRREWISTSKKVIQLPSPLKPDDWLLANVGLTAFVQASYDDIGWTAIIKQLMEDHTVFHPYNRRQFLEDARYSEDAVERVLQLSKYLANEEEYGPHEVFDGMMRAVDIILQDTTIYGNIRVIQRRVIEKQYDRLGWEILDNDSFSERLLRNLAIKSACRTDIEDCVSKAKQHFEQWRSNPEIEKVLHPDLADVVRCTAIKHGADSQWEFLLNRSLTLQEMDTALVCTEKPWLISRYLDLFLGEEEPAQFAAFTSESLSMSTNPVARPMLWARLAGANWNNWMKKNRWILVEQLSVYAGTDQEYDRAEAILERSDLQPLPAQQKADILSGIQGRIEGRRKLMLQFQND